MCKQWAEFQTSPGGDVRRVILLPEKGDKPVFLWMPVTYHALGARDEVPEDDCIKVDGVAIGARLDTADVITLKHTTKPVTDSTMLINGKVGFGKFFKPSIYAVHVEALSAVKHAAPNESLVTMLGAAVGSRWRGSLVICAATRNSEDSITNVVDISTSAFTLALNRIVYCYNGKDVTIPKTQGVKFNITIPFIQEVEVPLKHPAFKASTTIPIMEKLKWSVRTYKCPATSSAKSGAIAKTDDDDIGAAFDAAPLRICLDTSSSDFGTIPDSFHDDSASVLLVRTDMAPLTTSVLTKAAHMAKNAAAPALSGAAPSKEGREKALEAWIKGRDDFRRAVGSPIQ